MIANAVVVNREIRAAFGQEEDPLAVLRNDEPLYGRVSDFYDRYVEGTDAEFRVTTLPRGGYDFFYRPDDPFTACMPGEEFLIEITLDPAETGLSLTRQYQGDAVSAQVNPLVASA